MDPPPHVVCAVLVDGDRALLADQERPPDHVELARRDAIGAALERGAATGATWLWLVDGSVRPAPDALGQLLEPLAQVDALGDPVLFSSMVRDPAGGLDADAPPWPRLFWKENAILGAEHRLGALRAARYGSLLVHTRVLADQGAPRVDYAPAGDDLEWTARLLRETPGYLVPGSVVVRERDGRPEAGAYTRNRLRMLRGGVWVGQEGLWFAFLLTRDVARTVRARPAAAAGLARAVGEGVRASP